MEKAAAVAERARLQDLVDAYDASRLVERRDASTRPETLDRAANVRARIARLDRVIANTDSA
jgi:hypothetical protein